MKKFLSAIGICAAAIAYAQGTLILNNYSSYDFNGYIYAANPAPTGGNCYPMVGNGTPDPIVVPANSNTITGTQLEFTNYKDQFTNSLYPVSTWLVSTSATNQSIPRTWNHPAVMPGGTVSNNTRWAGSKFFMTDPATGASVPLFNANIAVFGSCNSSFIPDSFVCPSGSAEMFTISSGTTVTTYFEIY
ncbi:hypothetical protein ODZ84_09285 [Chryseobacterium fluminis]|uniref:hypothetical protein n=1 Tax=Chryseobacterium fluminis TaxID=2983606 RepID=UPI002257B443|nr:hypothetical protein [Chryseobacterium sp. MMS21-Ot14]UZT99739.1 hypothetical protein ODZ84_09285 [Chryseobacterium sp. MMS21-Ot14]